MTALLCLAMLTTMLTYSGLDQDTEPAPAAVQEQETPSAKTGSEPETSESPEDEAALQWRRVHPAGSGASAEMPGEPTEVTREFQVKRDKLIQVTLNTVMTPDEKHTFIFAWHDHYEPVKSQAQRKTILEGAVEGAVTRLMGDLDTVEPIRIQRFPGLAFTVRTVQQGKKLRVDQRIYLVRDRLYQLNVVGYDDSFDEEAAKRFFESFKFEKEAPPKKKSSDTDDPIQAPTGSSS